MATNDNITCRRKADGSRATSEQQTANLRPHTTTVSAKIVSVWRASPPPRTWVVALGFILIASMVLVQTYEAGREAGFQLAELAR